MVNGLLMPVAVFQEVGVVVMDFGVVRQSLDTRAKTRKKQRVRKTKQTNEVQTSSKEVFRSNQVGPAPTHRHLH